jgi:hypothetical protein
MTLEDAWQKMMDTPGSDFSFSIDRQVVLDEQGEALGPSAEAMDAIRQTMAMWVGTRIVRYMHKGYGPSRVEIGLSVTLVDPDRPHGGGKTQREGPHGQPTEGQGEETAEEVASRKRRGASVGSRRTTMAEDEEAT